MQVIGVSAHDDDQMSDLVVAIDQTRREAIKLAREKNKSGGSFALRYFIVATDDYDPFVARGDVKP